MNSVITVSVYWISGIPVHLLPDHFNGPASTLRSREKFEPNREDPCEEEPHEENDGEALKTGRPPREELLVRAKTRSTTIQRNPMLMKG
jgi:hypothetical protein